jgi:hypothetical protein
VIAPGRVRPLVVAGLVLAAVAVALVLAAGPGPERTVASGAVTVTTSTAERPGLLTAGIAVAVAAAVPTVLALVAALVAAARAARWGWFVLLLVLPGAALVAFAVVLPDWARRPAPGAG